MEILASRLAAAKSDRQELNHLITDYIPFIKSEVAKTPIFGMEFEDRYSLALLVFLNCVRQYDVQKGAFLPFVSVCIRNRMIDEGKKYARRRQREALPFQELSEDPQLQQSLSLFAYNADLERHSLREEIDQLALALQPFGISFDSLAKICPKQQRSRRLCMLLAQTVARDEVLRTVLLQKQRLLISELADRLEISKKTVEKYRRYIITTAVILLGDFPGIQAFLPNNKEVR